MDTREEIVLLAAGLGLWYLMHRRSRTEPEEHYANKGYVVEAGGSSRPDLWNRTYWKTDQPSESKNPAVNPAAVPNPHHNPINPITGLPIFTPEDGLMTPGGSDEGVITEDAGGRHVYCPDCPDLPGANKIIIDKDSVHKWPNLNLGQTEGKPG